MAGPDAAIVEAAICAIDRSPDPGTALADIDLATVALLTRGDLDNGWRSSLTPH